MHGLRLAVGAAWLVFWAYWIAAARGAKPGTHKQQALGVQIVVWATAILVVRVFHPDGLTVHAPAVAAVGALLTAVGLGFAVWARVHLGRNWGLPTTVKHEPELVTSGPYRLVRHPIYTGLLLAFLGTTLVTSLIALVLVSAFGASFYRSARVEERRLAAAFPVDYPVYRDRTKMLIPGVL
jgi:protein-S-isoprenylcysteine O-methyltransferase Ste14